MGNVTTAYFLFPYAFIGSRTQLEYIIKTNFTDEKLGKRSAMHISDQCFALFGVSIAMSENSVYRERFNDGILMLQQSGLITKIKNDVRWDMLRSSSGKLLQISTGKTLKIASTEEKGLTLADTEGMFLLLGIGFLIATGALVSEWVGGCTNKCIKIIKVKQEQKREEHRIEEEIRVEEEARIEAERVEDERLEAERLETDFELRHTQELAKNALSSAGTAIGLMLSTVANEERQSTEIIDERKSSIDELEVNESSGFDERKSSVDELDVKVSNGSSSSRGSTQHSRASSISVQDLSPAMLTELYHGPTKKHSNIVMIDGKMMSESEALKYASHQKKTDDKLEQIEEVNQSFQFLNQEEDDFKSEDDFGTVAKQVHHVEINLQAPTPKDDIEEFFGEKVEANKPKLSKKHKK